MTTNGQIPTSLHRILALLFTVLLFVAGNFLLGARAAETNDNANANGNKNTNANTNGNVNGNTNGNKNGNTNDNKNGNTNDNTNGNANPCPSPEEYAQVKVTRAYKNIVQGKEEKEAQLGNQITVEVEKLPALLAKAKCSNPSKNILLFLDGRPVKDAIPFPPTDPSKNLLVFQLKPSEASRELWTYILGSSKWSPRKTAVSVGLEDQYPVTSEDDATINLVVIPKGWFFFWSIIFLVILISFWLLAWKSDLLRDTGPSPAEGRKPYSLARTQAAWWFFLVLASYLFIGMITGDFSTTITSTVLGLLGISAGTVVGSAFIDAGKATTQGTPAGGAAAPAVPAVPAVPAAPGAPVAPAAPPPAPYVPKNEVWWLDILSDANGISFHRFQVAAWTLVLGIIFIIQVYKLLAMPTFDGSLLALLGISAGTYLGLKIPEPTTPAKQG